MSVMAHTSRVGYHELKYSQSWLYGSLMSANPSVPYGSVSLSGLSYRSQVVQSDHIRATSYSRCTARIFPGRGGFFKTGAHHVDARKPLISQMASIDAYAVGCNLPTGQVHIPEYLEGAAVNTALQNISQVSSNVLEDLAQAKQVASMAVSIYERIWELMFIYTYKGRRWRSLRGYLLHHAKEFPKVAGDAWLFYYYGIRPLVSTFNQLMKTYKGGSYTITGRGQRSDSLNIRRYIPDGSAGRMEGLATRSVRCVLKAQIKTTSSLLYWRGLGLSGSDGNASDLDAVVTLWALQPYSFVFDWFIPVENFLRSLYWSPEIRYTSGYISRRINGSGSCTATHFSGAKILQGTAPSVTAKLLYFQRVAYNDFPPLARLYLNTSLSPNQLKSAAALIATRG